MKPAVFVLKALTLPIWAPFWMLAKCWRLLAALLFIGIASGCTATSSHIEESPCAMTAPLTHVALTSSVLHG